jgi:hypothetical protein
VGVGREIAEADLLAVGEEDEVEAEGTGVGDGLGLGGAKIGGSSLSLEDGHGPALLVAEDVVGAGAVGERVFEADGAAVGYGPSGVP